MGLFSSIGKAVGGFAKKAAAKRNQRRAAADRKRATAEMSSLEKTRQKVINPYDNYANLSSLAKDLSGNLSNPYANMSVSTAAAEMKIEEADIALANTLDALMASGASAGGATALAQAALQSKKGVAASIEKQEAENERLRAGGEERLQQLELKEGQRVQQVQIQEGRRMQQGEMMGRKYKFDAQEKRDVRKMNFLRGEYKTAKGREYGASMAKASAIGDIASGLGGIADSAFGNPFAAKTPPGAGSATSGLQNYTPMATPTVSIPDYDLSISDRKLKKNIKLIGYSPSGLKIYVFEYINKAFGKGIFQGVMSDEIPQIAVIKHSDGYDKVDYSKIDVDFKQI